MEKSISNLTIVYVHLTRYRHHTQHAHVHTQGGKPMAMLHSMYTHPSLRVLQYLRYTTAAYHFPLGKHRTPLVPHMYHTRPPHSPYTSLRAASPVFSFSQELSRFLLARIPSSSASLVWKRPSTVHLRSDTCTQGCAWMRACAHGDKRHLSTCELHLAHPPLF